MSNWYYADAERQRQGPLAAEELVQRFHQGRLRLDTLVWREGLADWRALRDFSDELSLHQLPAETFYTPVAPLPAPPLPARPLAADPAASANLAGSVFTDTFVRPGSPYAPPSAKLTSDEAFYAGGEVVYAGFWKRVAAYVVDGLVVGIAGAVVGGVIGAVLGALLLSGSSDFGSGFLVIQLLSNLISIALAAAYYAGFHASTSQATLGKMAVGIKVVRSDGSRISVARGVGRYFATFLSSVILGIGFLMAAFTERKQGLHDMLCDTLVVDKWAYTAHPEWQKQELGTVTVVILAVFGVLTLVLGLIMAFALVGIAASMH
ncbi:MAG: RDD family protein [Pseudoxanthomonas sp.]